MCRKVWLTLLYFSYLLNTPSFLYAQEPPLTPITVVAAGDYVVFGGNELCESWIEYIYPEVLCGYKFLGEGTSTQTFSGDYQYYVIATPSVVAIDYIDVRNFGIGSSQNVFCEEFEYEYWYEDTEGNLIWFYEPQEGGNLTFIRKVLHGMLDDYQCTPEGDADLSRLVAEDGDYLFIGLPQTTPVPHTCPGCEAVGSPYVGAVVVQRPSVTILLTFDDGPEGDEDGFNSTRSVLDTLSNNSVQEEIKATFFTLTHGNHWGGTVRGESLLIDEHEEGHVVSIHAGGKASGPHFLFARHTLRVRLKAYPVATGMTGCGEVLKSGEPVGTNALESDLVAAIWRLKCLFNDPNYNPEFVRPPGYFYNDKDGKVLAAYSSDAVKCALGNCNGNGLKMILTDNKGIGDSGGPGPFPGVVSDTLKTSIKDCLQKNVFELVLTLHDSNDTTARNLNSYINDMRQAAQEEGYKAKFVDSDGEARNILNRRSIAGNWKCE